MQLIEKLNERKEKLIKEKENYKYGTHSTSCCWHMTHDIQLNSYKNTLISQNIWLWKVLVWIPSIKSCGIKSSLFILYTIKFLFYSNLSIYIYVWNSFLETWTLTLGPHIPQTFILIEWPPHQGCAVVKSSLLVKWRTIWFQFKVIVDHF